MLCALAHGRLSELQPRAPTGGRTAAAAGGGGSGCAAGGVQVLCVSHHAAFQAVCDGLIQVRRVAGLLLLQGGLPGGLGKARAGSFSPHPSPPCLQVSHQDGMTKAWAGGGGQSAPGKGALQLTQRGAQAGAGGAEAGKSGSRRAHKSRGRS